MAKTKALTDEWFAKTLKRVSDKEALGYENTMMFLMGMIRGWFEAKLITKKFYQELMDSILLGDEEPHWMAHHAKYNRSLDVGK